MSDWGTFGFILGSIQVHYSIFNYGTMLYQEWPNRELSLPSTCVFSNQLSDGDDTCLGLLNPTENEVFFFWRDF